jgi:hypothetical protein
VAPQSRAKNLFYSTVSYKNLNPICGAQRACKFFNVQVRARSQNEYIGNMSVKCLLFKEKIMFKNQLIKSNLRVVGKKQSETYGAPVFAPDCNETFFVAKMCQN